MVKIEELPHFEVSITTLDAALNNSLTGQPPSDVKAEITITKTNGPFTLPTIMSEYILIEKKILEKNLRRPKSSNPLMAELESFE